MYLTAAPKGTYKLTNRQLTRQFPPIFHAKGWQATAPRVTKALIRGTARYRFVFLPYKFLLFFIFLLLYLWII